MQYPVNLLFNSDKSWLITSKAKEQYFYDNILVANQLKLFPNFYGA